jgi:hypothetical protein
MYKKNLIPTLFLTKKKLERIKTTITSKKKNLFIIKLKLHTKTTGNIKKYKKT